MGNLIPWELLVAFLADGSTCPAKEDITLGSVAQLTGSGCTDNAGGIRSGVWDIVINGDTSSTDTFTGWSRSSPGETVSYWELNGTMLRSATGTVAVNLDLTLKFSAWSATQDYSLSGVVYDNMDGMNNAALNQAGGDYSASGTLEVAGVDTFEGALGVSNLGGCDDELDVMTLELDGPAETLHFSQSSKSCDGCTDWWSDEQSGSYCP